MPFWTSLRFGLAALGFLGSINLYAMRINLSVAMVCMVNNTAVQLLREAEREAQRNLTGGLNATDAATTIAPNDTCAASSFNSTTSVDEVSLACFRVFKK